jgi:hypothetical protein
MKRKGRNSNEKIRKGREGKRKRHAPAWDMQ